MLEYHISDAKVREGFPLECQHAYMCSGLVITGRLAGASRAHCPTLPRSYHRDIGHLRVQRDFV